MYGGIYWSVKSRWGGGGGGGRCMYVCARDGMHVQYISTILASNLIFSCDVNPLLQEQGAKVDTAIPAAWCNAVAPPYNNKETETEKGQVRDTQRRMGMVQEQAYRVR